MPGVVKMENGGGRTEHQKDASTNGLNGLKSGDGSRSATEKGKSTNNTNGSKVVNGGDIDRKVSSSPSRMNDLPDEIIHITQGFVPLSLFLTRLAQVTHNSLQDKIIELSKLPVPAGGLNGNAGNGASPPDDTSTDNLRKKVTLLQFIQDQHGKWVKALVIMEWSRKAAMVSKLIDLKFHIDQQRILYDAALDQIVNVKRDLTYARMPSPDLKTALQVLSTGSAPWMPDLQYIEPPALTAEEQLQWINDVNTLLSLRLNLEDYDKIPFQFRNYEISAGRVTFKVAGEFEVDLTIADEDFEKQFWFIDFRYAFSPSAASLPSSLRTYLEACVNDALGKEGLAGCYQFLHEFVLTSKINELKRQAKHLSRTSWTGTLAVEPLNRALAIQYWTSRNPSLGLKSWVLVAVNTGRKENGKTDPKSSSHVVAKWYRDNKEVKEVEILLDSENLSSEALLKTVIGHHVEYILSSIYDKLLETPRFSNREAAMTLNIAENEPGASRLAIQGSSYNTISLQIETTTGSFAVKPHSKFSAQQEHQLNMGQNPANDGMNCLERVRCAMMEDELVRSGTTMGWSIQKEPITSDELKALTKVREWTKALFLQKEGWGPSWFVVCLLSLGGDEWWLLETRAKDTQGSVGFYSRLPLNKGRLELTDSFWPNLTLFATGMIAQSVDKRELHRQGIKSKEDGTIDLSLPQQVRLPAIEIALSSLYPGMIFEEEARESTASSSIVEEISDNTEILTIIRQSIGISDSPKRPWDHNMVSIKFKEIQSIPAADASAGSVELMCVSQAVIKVQRKAKFARLRSKIDGNVSYNAVKGEFSLLVRRCASEPMLDALKPRIKAIDRFVNSLEAMDKARDAIICEAATLGKVIFSYPDLATLPEGEGITIEPKRWRVLMDLSKDEIGIMMEKGNPHLRVVDVIRHLVNSDDGIASLMAWLPVSLPALQAVDQIEAHWSEILENKQGTVEFSMKSVSWFSLAYKIFGPAIRGQRVSKELILEAKLRPRRGEAWWQVYRLEANSDNPVPADDEFSAALKCAFEGKGPGWVGLTTCAAGTPNGGIVGLLLAIDNALRELVPTLVGGMTPTVATTKPVGGQGSRPNSTTGAFPKKKGQKAAPEVVTLD